MANRYWVGGSATWNVTAGTKWALTSGGAGGQAVPTSSDDVFFDAASGAVTITVSGTRTCNNFDCTGFTGTLDGASTPVLGVMGNVVIASGMTVGATGPQLTLNATTTGKTLTFNGTTYGRGILFNGAGGGWTLQDALNNGASNINLTQGALDFNGQTVTTTGGITSNTGSATRSLTLGASAITCGGWNVTNTGLTINAGTSTITNTATTATMGNFTYYNLAYTSTTVGTAINGLVTCNNMNITAFGNVTFAATTTINGTFTVSGTSTQRTNIISNPYKTACTISAAVCSLNNCNFRDIQAAGAGTWSGTDLGDLGGNTGITFATPITAYWVNDGTAAHNLNDSLWFSTSGGSTPVRYPLPQDTMRFDANSFGIGSCVVTSGTSATGNLYANMDWTGVTNTPTFLISGTVSCYGDFILSPNMILTASGTFSITPPISTTFNTASLNCGSANLNINTRTGVTTTLVGDYVTTGTFTLGTGGNFTTVSSNITAASFVNQYGAGSTFNMGSGTYTLTGTGVVFTDGGSYTLNPGTSTIKLTNNSASSKTFQGSGGKTYYNFWNATSGAGVVNQDTVGTATFNDFKIDPGRTQQFRAASTTSFNTLTASGTLGNVVTITSISASAHNLVKLGTGLVSVDYMNISYSNASPSGTFFAGANSTDSGNNTNWIFTAPPAAAIASFDGVAIGNIKTINGVAIANIKTWNGI